LPTISHRQLDRGTIEDGGRTFHFAPWSERRNATNINWEFCIKVHIEGILVPCWAEQVAAMAIGKSCVIHYLEEKTHHH
jgi:hypothetical protein